MGAASFVPAPNRVLSANRYNVAIHRWVGGTFGIHEDDQSTTLGLTAAAYDAKNYSSYGKACHFIFFLFVFAGADCAVVFPRTSFPCCILCPRKTFNPPAY